jgi:hypothetical protein
MFQRFGSSSSARQLNEISEQVLLQSGVFSCYEVIVFVGIAQQVVFCAFKWVYSPAEIQFGF